MRNIRWIGTTAWVLMMLVLGTGLVAQSENTASEKQAVEEAAPPAEFDQYWMVFLERPETVPEMSEEVAAKIQRQHLGHLTRVWREGFTLVAGPFGAGPDDPVRGIVLYRGDLSEQEVRELAEADPAVVAGTLEVRLRPWYTGKGGAPVRAASGRLRSVSGPKVVDHRFALGVELFDVRGNQVGAQVQVLDVRPGFFQPHQDLVAAELAEQLLADISDGAGLGAEFENLVETLVVGGFDFGRAPCDVLDRVLVAAEAEADSVDL